MRLVSEVDRSAASRVNLLLDFHSVFGKVLLPPIDFAVFDGECQVSLAPGAVCGRVFWTACGDGGYFGVEEQHHAVAAAQEDVATFQSGVKRKSQNLGVEPFGR